MAPSSKRDTWDGIPTQPEHLQSWVTGVGNAPWSVDSHSFSWPPSAERIPSCAAACSNNMFQKTLTSKAVEFSREHHTHPVKVWSGLNFIVTKVGKLLLAWRLRLLVVDPGLWWSPSPNNHQVHVPIANNVFSYHELWGTIPPNNLFQQSYVLFIYFRRRFSTNSLGTRLADGEEALHLALQRLSVGIYYLKHHKAPSWLQDFTQVFKHFQAFDHQKSMEKDKMAFFASILHQFCWGRCATGHKHDEMHLWMQPKVSTVLLMRGVAQAFAAFRGQRHDLNSVR